MRLMAHGVRLVETTKSSREILGPTPAACRDRTAQSPTLAEVTSLHVLHIIPPVVSHLTMMACCLSIPAKRLTVGHNLFRNIGKELNPPNAVIWPCHALGRLRVSDTQSGERKGQDSYVSML